MKLYEIDDAIQNCFDPETGEVDEEQLIVSDSLSCVSHHAQISNVVIDVFCIQ